MRIDPILLYLALALVVVAAVFDLKSRRIPNYLTYPAVLLAFGYWIVKGDGRALLYAALGLLIGFILLLFLYLLGGMGAGDVKLMAALGALVGWQNIWNIVLYSLVAGGLVAAVYLLLRGELGRGLRNTWRLIRRAKFPGSGRAGELEWKSIGKIPYGVAIAMGTFYTLIPMLRL